MPSSEKNSARDKLSILVPAYNESANIEKTLKALGKYLVAQGLNYEIIVVDDGSRDNTAQLASNLEMDRVKVVRYQTNMGKGYAIRAAFDNSTGDVLALFDAGLDYQPEHITRFYWIMQASGADMVIGSKRHPQSQVDYPWKRRVISSMAQLMTKTLFNLNVKDTQVGMKVFRRRVLADILPRALVKRFAFDIELLALAQRYGYKIIEAPVHMNFNFRTSAVNPKAIWNSGWDTLAIFYRLKILKFYDKPAAEREMILEKMRRRYSSKG